MRLAIILLTLAGIFTVAAIRPGDAAGLGVNGKILLGRALAEHAALVQLQLAVEPEKTAQVEQWLRERGATVRFADTSVGFIRTEIVPTSLARIADFGDDVDGAAIFTSNQFDVELASPHGTVMHTAASPSTPPFDINLAGPKYTGAPPMRADAFIKDHPTFDGRGVIIGFMEDIDPRAPGLQVAYDLHGRRVRKVIDFGVIDSPYQDDEGAGPLNRYNGWVDMRAAVRSSHRTVVYKGTAYAVPYDGTYSIGTFYGSRIGTNGGEPFISMIPGKPTSFAFLWDRSNGNTWVDTLHTSRFAGPPIKDYATGGQLLALPLRYSDVMATYGRLDVSRWMNFAMKLEPNLGFLKLVIVGDTHAVMVGSSAAGNGMMGGRLNGIAPGARILCSDWPGSWSVPEQILWLVHHKADIVTSQFSLHFADTEGRQVFETVINRIAKRYGTVFTWAAGNDGPGIDTMESAESAPEALAIGGYLSRQTELLDDGINFEGQAIYSSRGPGPEGQVKPDVLAPTQWLADAVESDGKQLLAGKWRLPKEYSVGGGTSQATPTGAGAIALLISAARQTHIRYDIDSLKSALFSGARRVEGLPLDQGYGLIDVPRAWSFMRRYQRAPTVSIGLEPLYERDAPAGVPTHYSVPTQTSTEVAAKPSWVGSGGATINDSGLALAPLAPGTLRSGIFELRSNDGYLLSSWPVTQVAPLHFDASRGYSIVQHGTLAHPGYKRFFLSVPAGVSVLSLHLHESADGPGWGPFTRKKVLSFAPLEVWMPDGFTAPELAGFARWPASDAGDWRAAIRDPQPGTWQIVLYGADALDVIGGLAGAGSIPSSPIEFDAAIYALSLDGCTSMAGAKQCHFVNKYAPFQIASSATPAARHRTYPMSLTQDRPVQVIDVPVTERDVRDLRVTIDANVAPAVSRDLYYCPGLPKKSYPEGPWYRGSCLFRAHAEGNAALVASKPTGSGGAIDLYDTVTPGRWALVVYPVGAISSPIVGTVDVAIFAGKSLEITQPSQRFAGAGASFDATVNGDGDPVIESPDVTARYRRLTDAYQYLDLEKIPIVTMRVPIWP